MSNSLSYEARLSATKNKRLLMIAHELKTIITELLQRGQIKHQLLIDGYKLISVVKVDVAPNLGNAIVYINVNFNKNPEQIKAFLDALNSESKNIKAQLRGKLNTKNLPNFVFKQDETLEEIDKINTLLDNIKPKNEH